MSSFVGRYIIELLRYIEEYIIEPLRYTFSDGLKLLIGILLLVFNDIFSLLLFLLFIKLDFPPFILILVINLFVRVIILGYYIGVIKNTLQGLDTLPDWNNFGEIVKDGILYFIALIILYMLIFLPAILIIIIGSSLTIGSGVNYFTVGGDINYLLYTYLANLLSPFLLLTAILLYVFMATTILWIYTPLVTVNFAKKGFLGFFEVVDILKKKISLDYIVILVLYSLIFSIVCLALWIIGLIPVIGMAISDAYFCIFYFVHSIVFFRAVGKYYLKKV